MKPWTHRFPEGAELPLHKGVIVKVGISGDEGAPPVNTTAQCTHVSYCQRRKVLQPMLCLPAPSADDTIECEGDQGAHISTVQVR